jgi:hypothetical protein
MPKDTPPRREPDPQQVEEILAHARATRRPPVRVRFPLPVSEMLPWVLHYDRDNVAAAVYTLGVDTVEGFFVEPSIEVGSTVHLACDLGLVRIWCRRPTDMDPTTFSKPSNVEAEVTPWDGVKDPEYTVDVSGVFPGERRFAKHEGHLLIQLPRVDLRDSPGFLGGPDFLGSLARAVLRHKR